MLLRKMKFAFLVGSSLLIAGTALVQDVLPPGPTVAHRAGYTPSEVPSAFEVISLVLDFEAGAWTPMHSHGGEGVVLVLDGEMTVEDRQGTRTTYAAGDTWMERPGDVFKVGNDTDGPARILFTLLLPEGAELTTVHEE